MSKRILCLDFDGVCHMYTSGWQGATVIVDPPVEGLQTFLTQAQEEFDIAIYSSRSSQGGIPAMYEWFKTHCGSAITNRLSFPQIKPPAFITIDDRALTFNGTWPDIDVLKAFKPWNKRGEL